MFSKTTITIIIHLLLFSNAVNAQVEAGDMAPRLTITDWISNSLDNSDLQGKFLVIDFWATSCAPCLEVVPHMNTLVRAVF